MSISDQISAILNNRKKHLPTIAKQIEHWSKINKNLATLDAALQESLSGEPTAATSHIEIKEIRQLINNYNNQLRILEDRFNRSTINIGVSGQARVGKSTLLQSISGLGDEQVPTGDNLPVTAVKSQIFHSERNIADIEFHDFSSFKESILLPYHNELGLSTPETLSDFKSYIYPKDETELAKEKRVPSNITILKKLKQMQKAIWSYESMLGQPPRQIELSELREYVAYPTHEQELDESTCARKYLAVKDVKIYCTFPKTPVQQLGLIDLPGLGELSASLEDHHLKGVQTGVDFVLLIKKPGGTDGFWTGKDGSAVNLLDKAKSYQDRKDFISILINKVLGTSDEQLAALHTDILKSVNDDEQDKNYKVLEANVKDPKEVQDFILLPVLHHLADRLDVMDKKIIDGTNKQVETIKQRINALINNIEEIISQPQIPSNKRELIDDKADDLMVELASDLKYLRETTETRVASNEYSDKIEARSDDIKSWIDNGFGEGIEKWKEQARRSKTKEGIQGFIEKDIKNIRVSISKFYTELDYYFNDVTNATLNDVCDILTKRTGKLLNNETISDELTSRETLIYFRELLENIQNEGINSPCENLAQAIDNLLKVQLDYRNQLHPRVREHLGNLNYSGVQNFAQDADGNQLDLGNLDLDELYNIFSQLARSANYETKKALNEDSDFPRKVLDSVLEQLSDELIHGKNSVREIKRLAHAYAYDLWPEEFAEFEVFSSRYNRLYGSLSALKKTL